MHPLLQALARDRGDVFTPADARRAGYETDEIQRMRATGTWRGLRRGVYATAEVVSAAERAGERHRLDCAAVLCSLGRRSPVVSHTSAALLWGMVAPDGIGSEVRLTDTGQWREGRGYRIACASLPPSDVAVRDRLRVTAVPRTLTDCAREWTIADAVVAMDDALQRGLLSRDDLHEAVLAAGHWPGAGAAARAFGLSDERSESPLETRGRLRILGSGLPPYQLQVEIADDRGVIGVVDGWYDDAAVAIEFDGRAKYDRPWSDRSPSEVLWQEKRREDRLRALGIRIVRIVPADLGSDWWRVARQLAAFLAEPGPAVRPFRAVQRPERRLRPAG